MAAAAFRTASGLCVRCFYRELCRVVWRPQTALFSSKTSDRKQPRRTHIKKAKPQPAVDINELLEKLFSQRRPGAAPPAAGKARLATASPVPSKPPATSAKGSTSNVLPLSNTNPADRAPQKTTVNAAPPFPRVKPASPANPETSFSVESRPQSPLNVLQAYAADGPSNVTVHPTSTSVKGQTLTEVETAAEQIPHAAVPDLPLSANMAETDAATVEPLSKTAVESSLDTRGSVVEGPVDSTIDVPADEVPTKGADSGVVNILHTAKDESLREATLESSVETSLPVVEELETRASAVEEPTIDDAADVVGQEVQAQSTDLEAMTLESVTLAEVQAEVGSLETKVLQETRESLENDAEKLAEEEKMQQTATEDGAIFEEETEADMLTLDSIWEAADTIEAETSAVLEAMFGSERGPKQPSDAPLCEQELGARDEMSDQEAERQSKQHEGSVLEAMSLEFVTSGAVEASLGALERESLSGKADYLEEEAEILAGEKRMEIEEETAALNLQSQYEADAEDLQTDALMEELLFTDPLHGQIDQEVARATVLDAAVVDAAAAGPDERPALKEVLLGQEEEEEEDVGGGKEADTGMHKDLDPVQRLFLEKIREYNHLRRLNGGLLQAELASEKHLSEETAKLQRLYGGGDLTSFPQFTFTEPQMDQDSE